MVFIQMTKSWMKIQLKPHVQYPIHVILCNCRVQCECTELLSTSSQPRHSPEERVLRQDLYSNSSTYVVFIPAGTRRNNSVFTTSKRRRWRRFDVMKTLSLRHPCVVSVGISHHVVFHALCNFPLTFLHPCLHLNCVTSYSETSVLYRDTLCEWSGRGSSPILAISSNLPTIAVAFVY